MIATGTDFRAAFKPPPRRILCFCAHVLFYSISQLVLPEGVEQVKYQDSHKNHIRLIKESFSFDFSFCAYVPLCGLSPFALKSERGPVVWLMPARIFVHGNLRGPERRGGS